MKDRRFRLLHISRCRGVTRRTIRYFFHFDPTLKNIYLLSSTELSQLFSLPLHRARIFHSDLHHHYTIRQLEKDLLTFTAITIVDENYPGVLKQIKDPPIVLYAYGDVSLLRHLPALSVIGTRHPSAQAKETMAYIMKPLLKNGFLIVSGMAKGIDSFAHQITLSEHGKTIAVLGSGFDHVYPKQNERLFYNIAEKGLLLSEYSPHIAPLKYHFPERNRIISGLSFGTLVIEAMEKSGTLITVGQALDQGREVYAVPGSPMIPQTKGCHQLIRDGAKLVLHGNDILEDWNEIGKYLYDSIENG